MDNLAGIIAGALGGGAQAVQGMAQQQIEAQTRGDLMRQQQDAELAKAKAIEDYKLQLENSQRTAMAQRVGAARQGIINNAMDAKWQGAEGTDAAGAISASQSGATDPLTPEQQAEIEKYSSTNKANDAAKLANDPSTYVAAAAQTGDLDPKTIAVTNERLAAMQGRADALRDVQAMRSGTSMDNNTRTNDTRERIAASKLEAAKQKVGQLGGVDKAALAQAASWDRDIRTNTQTLNKLQDALSTTSSKDRPAVQQQIKVLKDDIAAKQSMRDKLYSTNLRVREVADGARDAGVPLTSLAGDSTGSAPAAGSGGSSAVNAALQKFNSMGAQ